MRASAVELAELSTGTGCEVESPPVSYRERTFWNEGGTSSVVTTVLNGVESCLSTNTGRVDVKLALASRLIPLDDKSDTPVPIVWDANNVTSTVPTFTKFATLLWSIFTLFEENN